MSICFNSEGFYSAVDETRKMRNATWKKVAAETGVSASTFTRMKQGRRPDVDTMAKLIAWSGLDPSQFIGQSASPQGRALYLVAPSTPLPKKLSIRFKDFVIQIHMRDNPELTGPVVVGGSPNGSGMIIFAGQDARARGVTNTVSAARAVMLCPELTFLKPDYKRYRDEAHAIRKWLQNLGQAKIISVSEGEFHVRDAVSEIKYIESEILSIFKMVATVRERGTE